MNNTIGYPTSGYTVLVNTLNGWELVWKVEDVGGYLPDIYQSEDSARKEIADILITELQEFIDDEREWDEITLDIENTYMVTKISIDESGLITITEEGGTEWDITLENWRKGL